MDWAALDDVRDWRLVTKEFTSQSEQISLRFAQERLFARAYAAFGALAVLLACIGLWAGRFVQTVGYGLSPSDPLAIGGAVALVAIVTALAAGAPRT